jgi:hypothetical protein
MTRENESGGGGSGAAARRRNRRQRRRQQRQSLNTSAQNNVYLGLAPLLDAISAQETNSAQQYDERRGQVGALYQALGTELGNIGSAYMPQAQQIQSEYLSGLGSVAGLFGGTEGAMPAEEIAASNGVGSAMGNSTLGLLASAAQRNLDYNSSAQRQGSIENMVTQRNMAMDLQQFLDALAQQRMNLERDYPNQLRAELDRLQQLRLQQQGARLANRGTRRALRSDRALAGYVRREAR